MKKRRQTREVRYQPPPPRKKPSQTKRTGGGLADRLRACRDAHVYALLSSLGRLLKTPVHSLLTIAVLTIAIAIAAGFQLLSANLQQLTGNLQASAQISLFLKDQFSDAEAHKLADKLRQDPAIKAARVIGKEQALAEFKAHSGFGEALAVLRHNPLPAVIELQPHPEQGQAQLAQLLQSLGQLEQVELAQMDTLWLQRLRAIIAMTDRALAIINTLLVAAVLFIVGNTIRQELHSRREEVVIAKLVGATDGCIGRPFLYTGFWLGFIAGLLAWFVVTLALLALWQSVDALAKLYGGSFHLAFFSLGDTAKLIGGSAALGVLASWLVLQQQLRHANPE